jgi:hypothetical protein
MRFIGFTIALLGISVPLGAKTAQELAKQQTAQNKAALAAAATAAASSRATRAAALSPAATGAPLIRTQSAPGRLETGTAASASSLTSRRGSADSLESPAPSPRTPSDVPSQSARPASPASPQRQQAMAPAAVVASAPQPPTPKAIRTSDDLNFLLSTTTASTLNYPVLLERVQRDIAVIDALSRISDKTSEADLKDIATNIATTTELDRDTNAVVATIYILAVGYKRTNPSLNNFAIQTRITALKGVLQLVADPVNLGNVNGNGQTVNLVNHVVEHVTAVR